MQSIHVIIRWDLGNDLWESPSDKALLLWHTCQSTALWLFSDCDLQDGTDHIMLPKENACQSQGRLLTFIPASWNFQICCLFLSLAIHLQDTLCSCWCLGGAAIFAWKVTLAFPRPERHFLFIHPFPCQTHNEQLWRSRHESVHGEATAVNDA